MGVRSLGASSRRNNVATRAVIFIYNILRIAYRNQSLLPMDFFRFSFLKITVLQNRIHKYNTPDTEEQTSLIFIMCHAGQSGVFENYEICIITIKSFFVITIELTFYFYMFMFRFDNNYPLKCPEELLS